MKKLSYLFILILFTQTARAQKEILQSDEGNKYVYYRVVDKSGVSADTLYSRSLSFMKMANLKFNPASTDDRAVTGKGKFMVYNGSSIVRKEAGEVTYKLYIESKDQKYRYKVSDFVFTPYRRDRYGNMVAVTGVEVAFEKLATKFTQKEADSYLNQTGSFCQATADAISKQMNKVSQTKIILPPNKVNTYNW
ncbi:DUF4468 domain-containing protein [Mucilaginibacter sp.]|uniref:DUF4468 domain-containing protein n=1 Tax=Mucilaginibacter sp. TaxID=1882438 RepID=UPI0035BC9004